MSILSMVWRGLRATLCFLVCLPGRLWRARGYIALLVIAVCVAFGVYVYIDYWYIDTAESFPNDPVRQFEYGSTGGDRLAGIPVGIFNALPVLCQDYLPRQADGRPGQGWQALGFIYEPGMDRPIGTSKRRSLGF